MSDPFIAWVREKNLSWSQSGDKINLSEAAVRKLFERVKDIETVLQFYVDTFPAFRSKPVGAPGSDARQAQNHHIDYENMARKFLPATSKPKAKP